MRPQRTLPAIAVVVAVVAMLSGCHGPSGHSGSPSSTTGSSSSATPSATPTPTPTATAAGGVPTCTLDQLNIVYSPTDNTAGHAHGVLTFANTSQQNCSLTGYATVVFDNPEAQQPMGQPATHDPSEPTGPAVASIEGFSTADLTITNAGFVEGCTIVTAIALLVTPPGLSQYRHVPIPPTQACQNDDIGLLTVSSNYIPPGS
ncbi:MAG: DUF4232 domain-containing protein [Pseudolysinimonas sp.]